MLFGVSTCQPPINLLFTYKAGQPPLIITYNTYKEVYKMLNERVLSDLHKEMFPIYLLKIEGDMVVLGKKVYPMEEKNG